MSTHADGQFEVTSWEEDAYDEFGENGKLTHARVEQTFRGDIEGEGAVQYLMVHSGETAARFVGQQRIDGSVEGRPGTVVLHVRGTFDGDTAEATWTVVPESTTGELRGLKGEGRFSAPLGSTASYDLDYEWE